MMLRRRLPPNQRTNYYEFTAGADGFVGKHTVPIKPGDYITIEWDVSRYTESPSTENQTAFTIGTQTGQYADPSDCGLSGTYPICSDKTYNTAIFKTGTHSFTAGPTAYNVHVCYWNRATMNTRNYRLYGDYVKVYINQGGLT